MALRLNRCGKCGALLGKGEDCKDCFLALNEGKIINDYYDDKYTVKGRS